MTTTVTYTPWGWTKDVEELAEGVWRVSTPSHGGLKLSRERWDELPSAAPQRHADTQTFAEEDCEEPIVRTIPWAWATPGRGNWRSRSLATSTATPRRCPTFATPHTAFTTTPSPTGTAAGRTPSSGSTPASRPSPSWATPGGRSSTGAWRPSSAPRPSRSAREGEAGRDWDGWTAQPTPAATAAAPWSGCPIAGGAGWSSPPSARRWTG